MPKGPSINIPALCLLFILTIHSHKIGLKESYGLFGKADSSCCGMSLDTC